MKKTNQEWFNTLPDNLRACALEAGKRRLLETSSSLAQAINDGIVWDETLQVYDFWEKVYDAANTLQEMDEEASAYATSLELSDRIIQHIESYQLLRPYGDILKKEIAFIIKDYVFHERGIHKLA